MDEAAKDPLPLPRNLMVVVALAQGLLLLLLWRALTHETWPSQTPALNLPLWTLAVTGPTLFLLTVEADNLKRAALFVTAFAAILAVLAVYVGWQASPVNAFPTGALIGVFVLTMLVACFKGAMYLQQFAVRERIHYPALFSRSWRNFGVFGLSWTLTGGVALVLGLWGALFAVIGIDFFQELFREDWFLFPVLTVAFGLGVFIFRRLTRVIDGVTSLLEGLMRLLLPLTAAVVAIFLAALPFTGLAPLWETGNGTALLMALNAITLFTVNAVYQTDRHAPYPLFVHRPLYVCVALLPVVSALSVYGLSLRVAQYGWTVERCWALTLAVLFAAFSLGYTWSIVRHRDRWPAALGRVNVAMGWVVLGTMLLVNTPLLDFRKISLASQFGRVEAGEIALRDFDFRYAREQLARPGWLRLEALAEEHEADPELTALIRPVPPGPPGERIWDLVTLRPEPFEVPEGLRTIAETRVVRGRREHHRAGADRHGRGRPTGVRDAARRGGQRPCLGHFVPAGRGGVDPFLPERVRRGRVGRGRHPAARDDRDRGTRPARPSRRRTRVPAGAHRHGRRRRGHRLQGRGKRRAPRCRSGGR